MKNSELRLICKKVAKATDSEESLGYKRLFLHKFGLRAESLGWSRVVDTIDSSMTRDYEVEQLYERFSKMYS